MVLIVVWAVSAQVLQSVPQGPVARNDRSNTFDQGIQLASHRTVSPSGAEPAYPPNHMLDSQVEDKGAAPNAGFETAGGPVGSRPANSDLEGAASTVLTVPNGDFATGTFQDWTTAGGPTIDSDATHGSFARLGTSTSEITSSALAIPSNAQTLTYDVGYLRVSGQSWVDVFVLTGPTFGTSTKVKEDNCNNCNYWSRSYVDLSPYQGRADQDQVQGQGLALHPCRHRWRHGRDPVPRPRPHGCEERPSPDRRRRLGRAH